MTTRESPRSVDAVYGLVGRAALVTGAGSATGIGFATAKLLGALGANVLVTSTSDRIHDRVGELRALGVTALGVTGDLTEPSTARLLVETALTAWGRLEIVVQNAGLTSVAKPTTESGNVESMDFEVWRAGMSRNLDTAFLVAKASVPVMASAGWGRFILVSSVTGPVMAMRNEPAYAAAKAGMVGLARALAVDAAPRGVTVNAVAPGWILTGSQTPHEAKQAASTPIGRSAAPDEVASAICWLASPGASYITGQCLVVDGGNSISEERS